jgi:phage terminase small subunit
VRPPAGTGPAGRAAWRRAIITLREIGEDPALSVGALAMYARDVDTLAELRRQWREQGGQATTTTSSGRVLAHPMPAIIADWERLVADDEHRLGLTPKARRALGRAVGRPQGGASAPDRAAVPRRTLRKVVPIRPDAG